MREIKQREEDIKSLYNFLSLFSSFVFFVLTYSGSMKRNNTGRVVVFFYLADLLVARALLWLLCDITF